MKYKLTLRYPRGETYNLEKETMDECMRCIETAREQSEDLLAYKIIREEILREENDDRKV